MKVIGEEPDCLKYQLPQLTLNNLCFDTKRISPSAPSPPLTSDSRAATK